MQVILASRRLGKERERIRVNGLLAGLGDAELLSQWTEAQGIPIVGLN